jgi:hypothetical protein
MTRGRGRPPSPPPPYEQFNSKACKELLASYKRVDGEARELSNDRTELKNAWRDRGLDWDAMAPVEKLSRKIAAGKISVQDAKARIDRLIAYADWAFGDQTDLFRVDTDKPASADGAADVRPEGDSGKPIETEVNQATQGNGAPKAAGKRQGRAKGRVKATVSGDAEAALAAVKQPLGTSEPVGSA